MWEILVGEFQGIGEVEPQTGKLKLLADSAKIIPWNKYCL